MGREGTRVEFAPIWGAALNMRQHASPRPPGGTGFSGWAGRNPRYNHCFEWGVTPLTVRFSLNRVQISPATLVFCMEAVFENGGGLARGPAAERIACGPYTALSLSLSIYIYVSISRALSLSLPPSPPFSLSRSLARDLSLPLSLSLSLFISRALSLSLSLFLACAHRLEG